MTAPFAAPPLPPTAPADADADPSSGVRASGTFDAFIRESMRDARRRLVRSGVPTADAEDLIQSTFLALLHLDHLPANLPAWFAATLERKGRARRRNYATALKNEPTLRRVAEIHAAPSSVRPEALRDVGELLALLVAELPPERRKVAHRHFFHDETMEEIAVALGLPLPVVKSRWRFAKAQINAATDRENAKKRLHFGALLLSLRVLLGFVRRVVRLDDGRAALAAHPLDASRVDTRYLVPSFALVALGVAVSVSLATHGPLWGTAFARSDVEVAGFAGSALAEPVPHDGANEGRDAIGGLNWRRAPLPSIEASSTPRPVRPPPASSGVRLISPSAPRFSSVTPQASATTPQATAPNNVPPALAKAREALNRGNLEEAAGALQRYEQAHPDPNEDDLHRGLRLDFARRLLDVGAIGVGP